MQTFSTNTPFKAGICSYYNTWLELTNSEQTKIRHINKKNPLHAFAQWFQTQGKFISNDLVEQYFLKFSISNAIDRTEDDIYEKIAMQTHPRAKMIYAAKYLKSRYRDVYEELILILKNGGNK